MKNLTRYSRILLALFCSLVFLSTSCQKGDSGDDTPAAPTPEISSITPKNPQPGDVVTVKGKNFGTIASDIKITIGGADVPVQAVSATEITFSLPASVSGGAVEVKYKGVTVVNKDPDGATLTPKAATPTFTALSPSSGKAGDIVTISGTNFSSLASDNKVFFATNTGGTVVLATIKTASATTLTVEVPASAITGTVTVSVKSVNAITPTGFTPTFTVTSTATETAVSYITAQAGTAKFSKVATVASEPVALYIDKTRNILYYSDYSLLNQTNTGIYKIDLNNPGSDAVRISTDARLSLVTRITTDNDGNVYVLKYESGLNYSIYKLKNDGTGITEFVKNFEMAAGVYHFFVNTSGEVSLRPDLRYTASGTKITTGPNNLNVKNYVGALYNGNTIYLAQTSDNSNSANKLNFVKFDIGTNTATATDITLKGLFNDDDPENYSSNVNISRLRYTVDNSENLYVITNHAYISGALSNTWMIRKTKNGSGTSTLVSKFLVKFPATDIQDLNGLEFASDASGNLYTKANVKDIIKITL